MISVWNFREQTDQGNTAIIVISTWTSWLCFWRKLACKAGTRNVWTNTKSDFRLLLSVMVRLLGKSSLLTFTGQKWIPCPEEDRGNFPFAQIGMMWRKVVPCILKFWECQVHKFCKWMTIVSRRKWVEITFLTRRKSTLRESSPALPLSDFCSNILVLWSPTYLIGLIPLLIGYLLLNQMGRGSILPVVYLFFYLHFFLLPSLFRLRIWRKIKVCADIHIGFYVEGSDGVFLWTELGAGVDFPHHIHGVYSLYSHLSIGNFEIWVVIVTLYCWWWKLQSGIVLAVQHG